MKFNFKITNTVKPVYKGHSKELENAPFIDRLKLYALIINGKNEFLFLLLKAKCLVEKQQKIPLLYIIISSLICLNYYINSL